jgi:methylated-DNA-[protein]-cysteine S-methyltransferase
MTMRTHTVMMSPIGDLTLVNTNGMLSGLYTSGHKRGPRGSVLGDRVSSGFEQAIQELNDYFSGALTEFTVPIAVQGNAFQRRVWALVKEIPFGETRSYGDLAEDLGDPTLAREVGAANAGNPICIIVPCHRVVGRDGSLTGYAGGLHRKRYLLDHEVSVAGRAPALFQYPIYDRQQ